MKRRHFIAATAALATPSLARGQALPPGPIPALPSGWPRPRSPG